MNKEQARRNLRRLRNIKTWQLIVLLVIVGFVAAIFLRLNNVGMVERRNAVLTADDVGDDNVTKDRLYDLQAYVSTHMNTDMGKGVYLESSYKRAMQKAYANASSDTNPYGNIYKKAQEYCAPKYTHYSYAYLQCTMAQLEKYPASGNLIVSANLPKATLYLHDYESPLWTPDFAGWSVALFGLITVAIIARLLGVIILKMLIKQRYKSI